MPTANLPAAGGDSTEAGGGVSFDAVASFSYVPLQLASDHREPVAVWVVFAPAVCWSFVATGLYVWRHRPETRIGALMVALGFAWLLF